MFSDFKMFEEDGRARRMERVRLSVRRKFSDPDAPHNRNRHGFQRKILVLYARAHSRHGKPLGMKSFLEGLEQYLICGALKATFGNQRKAAQLLGLKYTTLNEKVRRFGIHAFETWDSRENYYKIDTNF